MPWVETCRMDQRIQFVVLASQADCSFSHLCRDFGVSRKTGYKWLKRYREALRLGDLREESRRPLCSPYRTSLEVEELVVRLRKRHDWGGRKLEVKLRERGVVLDRRTIDRIIKRRGLVAAEDRPNPAPGRFERGVANELWQMDFKGEYRLRAGQRCYPLTLLDDHSRYSVGVYALEGTAGEPVWKSLVHAFERYGLPETMLMDHGVPWWSVTGSLGLTWVSVKLIQQGVRLSYSGIRHPQTQGKLERFHRTLKRSLRNRGVPEDLRGFRRALRAFRNEYNQERPHEALDMAVPAQRYERSPRGYHPTPAPWEYPEGADVRRLNTLGMLEYAGRRHFVCEALAGQWVQCQRFENRLLVTFRHMQVREIDIETGRTSPLVRPAIIE
jgi:transposase InsO family protein